MIQRFLVLATLVALAGGCVTADVTLAPDGSAKLNLQFPAGPATTKELAQKMLAAPGVTLDKVEVADIETEEKGTKPRKRVTASLSTDDVDKLEEVPFFKVFGLAVERPDAVDGKREISVSVANAKPGGRPPSDSPNTISVRTPAEVAETSGKLEDGKVVWAFPTSDFFSKPKLTLTFSYADGAAAKPAEGAEDKPAEAKPAEAKSE